MEPTYRIIRSNRKTIAIQIKPGGEVVVRCPKRMPLWEVRAFVHSKADWITKHASDAAPEEPPLTAAEIEQLREKTRRLTADRAAYYAPAVGVEYGRIAVRAQRTRWGSCSGRGNLNFNCLLALAPAEVLDYVVVHELCHRKHMNHSPVFWAEVERVFPDYRRAKQWLRENGSTLLARFPARQET